MKIFQVITLSELGGAQTVLITIANQLCKKHDVVVIAGSENGKMWDLLDPSIKKECLPSLQRQVSLIKEIKTCIMFRRLYCKYKPDIIHLHSSKAGFIGRIIFPKHKIVYTVHGFDSVRIAHRKYLSLEKTLQNNCKAIVGVSLYDKIHLLEEGITHNVYAIYNGLKRPESLKNDPFTELNCYSRKILTVARLSPQKNVDLFLSIASSLPEYAFIWVGNQCELGFKYPRNVFFMGSIPNAGSYNEYVDLFMLSSNYEGLPMVIIEAMAMGKPVVASDVGGIREVVHNGENGYVVTNDVKLFVEKIVYILENKEIYKEFSQNAFNQYAKYLTADRMVDKYLEIYDL